MRATPRDKMAFYRGRRKNRQWRNVETQLHARRSCARAARIEHREAAIIRPSAVRCATRPIRPWMIARRTSIQATPAILRTTRTRGSVRTDPRRSRRLAHVMIDLTLFGQLPHAPAYIDQAYTLTRPEPTELRATAAPPLTALTAVGTGNADRTASQKPACQKQRAPPPEKTTASKSGCSGMLS